MSDIIFENRNFRLTLNEKCQVISLFNKSVGEELIAEGSEQPFFSAVQNRPYNNELKLAYMNKRTEFGSSAVRREGNDLFVKFGFFPFEAIVGVDVKDEYMVCTLKGFKADEKDYPQPMDFPPVTEFALMQLAVDSKHTYGQWMNVVHTEKSSVAVMATEPEVFIDSELQRDIRILNAKAKKGIKLLGASAALIVGDREKLLDAVDSMEHDFGLPLGVESRRGEYINSSVYWTLDLTPENVDEHISYAKKGGFRLMLLYFTCMCKSDNYAYCGDYSYNENYPNGEADMRLVIEKIKAAGIKPGLHFLHTHVGVNTKYVTPYADRRLNLKRRFTLSKPLSKDSDTVFIDESPIDCPLYNEKSRLLRFDGEIISYEGYTAEYPYCFTGCKRGCFNTTVTEHKEYTVGGVLDVSEYGATSIYLDQNTDLQEEIGRGIADIYNCGFEFIYYDGSEGTDAPFEYQIPNAQYRIYRMMNKPPLFCEGAAKAHFGWHILSGGNAFDVFPTEIFKEMIIEHPFKEAELMKNDHTRLNFGWWAFREDTRVDVYEFGTSKAAAYDCPATVMADLEIFKKNPNTYEILEMMSRWEDVRAKKWLTPEQKEMLKDPNAEYTLLKKPNGDYELKKL